MRRGDDGLLHLREFIVKRRRRVGAHKTLTGGSRVIAHEDGSSLVSGRPRQGAVHEGLDEQNRVTGARGDLNDSILMGLVEPDIVRTREIGLVAARETGESSVSGSDIGKLHGDIGHAAIHAAVAIHIRTRGIDRFAAFMKPESLGALVHGNTADAFQAEPCAQYSLQSRHKRGVNHHLTKYVTIRFVPGQRAAHIPAPCLADKRGR